MLLVAAEADRVKKNSGGLTALEVARRYGTAEVVALLKQADAEPEPEPEPEAGNVSDPASPLAAPVLVTKRLGFPASSRVLSLLFRHPTS